MDAYSKAHLAEIKERIDRALDAGYTFKSNSPQQPIMMMMIGKEGDEEK